MGSQRAVFLRETIAVSVTISYKRAKLTQPNPSPSSSTRQNERNVRREPEVPEAEVPVEECFDCPARITSKELAPIHSVKKWHPPECLFYKSKSGCQVWRKVLLCASPG